jgi:hypothetical protein
MNNYFALLLLFLTICNQYSTAQSFQKNTIIASFGIGSKNNAKTHFIKYATNPDYKNYKSSGVGVLHAKLEIGVGKRDGLSLSINHAQGQATFEEILIFDPFNYVAKHRTTKFNLRYNFHLIKKSNVKIDPYFGCGIGYGIVQTKIIASNPTFSTFKDNPLPIGAEMTLGMRYFMARSLGIYGEIGVAKSVLQIGISYRLNHSKN